MATQTYARLATVLPADLAKIAEGYMWPKSRDIYDIVKSGHYEIIEWHMSRIQEGKHAVANICMYEAWCAGYPEVVKLMIAHGASGGYVHGNAPRILGGHI